MSAPNGFPAASRPLAWAGLVATLVLVAIAFSPARDGEFLGDDLDLLARVSTGSSAGSPFEGAVLSLTHDVAGFRPRAFHVVSIVAHLLSTAALFLLARCVTQRAMAALVATAIFGLHPVHAECVARISALHTPLAGLCVLLALFVFASTDARGALTWRRYATSIALFLCGLLADSNAIAFLPIAIAIDLCMPRRGERRARNARCAVHAGFMLTWLVFRPTDVLVRLSAFHPGRALVRVDSIGHAVEQLAWPFGSSVVHPLRPDIAWSDPTIVVALASLVAWIGASVWLYRSERRLALLGLLFIPAALLHPLFSNHAAGAHPITSGDLYLPAAGLALIVARAATTKTAAAIASVIAIVFAIETHARTRNWRSDLAFLETAVAEHPENPKLLWRLGDAQLHEYTAHGDLDQLNLARQTFQAALDLLERAQKGDRAIIATSGDFVQSNLGLGWSILFHSEHDPNGVDDTAYRVFEMVIARYPESAEAHMALGVAALALGRLDESERAFDKSLELRPENAEALHNLGQLRVRQRDWTAAIKAFERALQSRPDHVDDLVSLARALAESGQEARAIEIVERAATIDPDSPLPAVVRGTLEARRGAFESALSWSDRALALDPDDGEALILRGKILLARGELNGARTAFMRAADRLPQSFEAHYNLAALLLKHNDRAAAVPHLVHAYTLRPFGSASAELHRSLAEIGIQSPETYWRLASSDVARGELDGAEEWLGRALALDPDHGPSHMLRARVSEQRGDVDGAIAALERACRAMPESYPANYTLGETLIKAGRTKEALVHLEHALAILTKSNDGTPQTAVELEGLRRRIDDVRSKSP